MTEQEQDRIIDDAIAAGIVTYHQNTAPFPGVFVYRGIKYRANANVNNLDALAAALTDAK